jgi:exodeoxyribonuclease V alpha subunit
LASFEGTIEEIVYHNETNGYTVCSVNINGEAFSVVGKIFFIREGEFIKFEGQWVKHPQYGQQISISSYEKIIPSNTVSLLDYLSTGIIKGIGPKLANRIVKEFGDESLNIIRFFPEKLSNIKGITYDKAIRISEEIETQIELNSLVVFFNEHNIPASVAAKVYKKMYGVSADLIKENPYILSDDEYGLSFKTIDNLALKIGFQPESEHRLRSGLKYILFEASNNGHSYMLENILKNKVKGLLNTQAELAENALISLEVNKEIFVERKNGENRVYLYKIYEAEMYCAQKLSQIAEIEYESDEELAFQKIKEYEAKEKISFAHNQIEAIKEAMHNGVVVITGGPGTGKTTIIKAIIELFEYCRYKVVLTAPTGRAAKRMSESTGKKAKTIHRLLEVENREGNKEPNFIRDEKNPLNAEVIIVDETSMVDVVIMSHLLKAVAFPTRVILVGDIDQLPSVGPGNVLKDIIDCGKIKTVRLNEIFRQASKSMIIVNAHKINSGEIPLYNIKDSDFFMVREGEPQDVVKTVVDLYARRLPSFYGFQPLKDIQVISPTRKGLIGVSELNKELQKIINPPSEERMEKKYFDTIFRMGDRVMQTRNNYNLRWNYHKDCYTNLVKGNLMPDIIQFEKDFENGGLDLLRDRDTGEGVFNGDTGIIADIDRDGESVTVFFEDDRIVVYDNNYIDQLEHAFCVTVHKSQGSEFPAVIIPILEGPKVLFTRSLLYTAVTRAKSLVVIVGNNETVKSMIKNDLRYVRFSSLSEKLILFAEENIVYT